MQGKDSTQDETYCMATAKRLDVEKGKDFVALEKLKRREITCNTCKLVYAKSVGA